MLKAKSLVAEVDMLPLMLGDVAVPRVRLVEPEILVKVRKSGRSNWDEIAEFETCAGGASAGIPPTPGFNNPAVLSSGNITLTVGTVTVSNAGATTSFALPSASFDLSGGRLPCL
ncbi:MAG: hypothetical protein VW405_06885 [Rhodospirillaceae bacterium]